jgi:hypothetical protein
MKTTKAFWTFCLILSLSGLATGADVILNEYNAVDDDFFLNGGNSSVDDDRGRASDSYFGRVKGNGGDWFEMVVITDHLDMRNWKLEINEDGTSNDETIDLTNHSIWSDLRSGTIITVSEDLPSDVSYDPNAGDWWINVQANNDANGVYIEATNFAVSNSNWQLTIRNAAGTVKFGPAGEGISPASGISDTEVFQLKTDPSALITPTSTDYSDESSFSTFGSSNQWGVQNINQLRTVIPTASTITVLAPNGSEIFTGGTTVLIQWNSTGPVNNILLEYSLDNGNSWSKIIPQNVANTGSFDWLVPMVSSEQCQVRVVNADNLAVYDISNNIFFIYQCSLDGDLTGDCFVDFDDFAVIANDWLDCADPYNPSCL